MGPRTSLRLASRPRPEMASAIASRPSAITRRSGCSTFGSSTQGCSRPRCSREPPAGPRPLWRSNPGTTHSRFRPPARRPSDESSCLKSARPTPSASRSSPRRSRRVSPSPPPARHHQWQRRHHRRAPAALPWALAGASIALGGAAGVSFLTGREQRRELERCRGEPDVYLCKQADSESTRARNFALAGTAGALSLATAGAALSLAFGSTSTGVPNRDATGLGLAVLTSGVRVAGSF